MEVPTGAISDLLGKKITLIIGYLFELISCVIIISASSFRQFLWGQILMFIGFAFISGALEAFAYDSLAEKGLEKKYGTVISKYIFIAIAATIFSTFSGGFLYKIRPEFTFGFWIVFLIVAIGLLLFSTEPKVDTIKFSFKSYYHQLFSGVKTLFNVRLLNYIVPIIFITCLIKLYQGIVRQSIGADFGFTGESFSYLLGIIMVPAAFISYKFDRIKLLLGNKRLLLLILAMYGIAFATPLIIKNLWWGGLIFIVMMSAEKLGEPLISVLINDRVDSQHRATTLSTLALISQIPYIVLVLFFAKFTDIANIHWLYLLYTFVIAFGFIYSLVKVKKE